MLAVLVAVLYAFNPESHGLYPRCPLFMLTGLQCAGCGTLRALHCLLHGDVARAVSFNPILALGVPLLIVLALRPQWGYNRCLGWGVAVVVIAYSILRNIT